MACWYDAHSMKWKKDTIIPVYLNFHKSFYGRAMNYYKFLQKEKWQLLSKVFVIELQPKLFLPALDRVGMVKPYVGFLLLALCLVWTFTVLNAHFCRPQKGQNIYHIFTLSFVSWGDFFLCFLHGHLNTKVGEISLTGTQIALESEKPYNLSSLIQNKKRFCLQFQFLWPLWN